MYCTWGGLDAALCPPTPSQAPPPGPGPHLDGHRRAVLQGGAVNLRQAGGRHRLVVELLEEAGRRRLEVLQEELVHLRAQGGHGGGQHGRGVQQPHGACTELCPHPAAVVSP